MEGAFRDGACLAPVEGGFVDGGCGGATPRDDVGDEGREGLTRDGLGAFRHGGELHVAVWLEQVDDATAVEAICDDAGELLERSGVVEAHREDARELAEERLEGPDRAR